MPPSKAALAKIHIAKKDLALSDESYRDILHLHFRVDSAARLTDRQATVLLNLFERKGWKPKRSAKKPTSPKYDDSQARKVVALWIALADAGVVKNRSDIALQKYVKRMTGVDNLKWCGGWEFRILIEGLKQWAAREDVDVD